MSFVLYSLYKSIDNEIIQDEHIEHIEEITEEESIEPAEIAEPKEEYKLFTAINNYGKVKSNYINTKDNELLLATTKTMLKEIIELLREVHQNADTQEERTLIKKSFSIISSLG